MTPARRRRPSSAARRNPAKARQRAKAAREELPEPPEYLKRLGVRPRKALGQHFLVDEFLLGDIADAAVRDVGVPVLEIDLVDNGSSHSGHIDDLEVVLNDDPKRNAVNTELFHLGAKRLEFFTRGHGLSD